MTSVLFVNPRAGRGGPPLAALEVAAHERGVRVHLLTRDDDLADLVEATSADVLGIAGGDGSLGTVARAAIERDLPLVCVPWGTRNHFASDLGLDASDPLEALDAFRDGVERRVDVGRLGDTVFVNNVSLGLYGRLVHRREGGRRRGDAFARLRALLVLLRERHRTDHFVVDGERVRASVLLVANNAYRLDLFSLGTREALDAGTLAVYAARGVQRLRWTERTTERVRIEAARRAVPAAIDGEPVLLEPPLELRIEPRALRVRIPARAA